MKKLNLFVGFFLLLFFSCAKDGDLWDVRPEGEQPCASHVVPVEDALSVLGEFLAPLEKDTRSVGRYAIRGVDVVASGAATRSGKGADTLIYIVNFENEGGYALLGADDRVDPLIALVDEGNMTAEEFLAIAASDSSTTRSNITPPNGPLFRNILQMIDRQMDDGGANPIPEPYYADWQQSIAVEPLVTTKWGQGSPYNKFCPVVDGRNCMAGCVAIALAQIAAYNKMVHHVGPDILHEIPLDWTGILARVNSIEADPTAAALLVYAMGREVDMRYGLGASSSNIDKAARALPWLGYWDVSNTRYNNDIIRLMVCERRLPVYMRGVVEFKSDPNDNGGHGWVVDGYYQYYRLIYNKDPSYPAGGQAYVIGQDIAELVHCNFGWYGRSDGYYISNMFQTDGPVIPDPTSGKSDIYNLIDKRMLSYQL